MAGLLPKDQDHYSWLCLTKNTSQLFLTHILFYSSRIFLLSLSVQSPTATCQFCYSSFSHSYFTQVHMISAYSFPSTPSLHLNTCLSYKVVPVNTQSHLLQLWLPSFCNLPAHTFIRFWALHKLYLSSSRIEMGFYEAVRHHCLHV